MTDINALREEWTAKVEAAADDKALEDVRVAAIGKKGAISLAMKTLGKMDPEERKTAGPALNALKAEITDLIASRKAAFEAAALNARLASETIDITLPTRPEETGTIHPISQVMDEVVTIFADMGFAVAEGPDIEDDDHNFNALNIPPEHPARQMHDTFYFAEKAEGDRPVLRTHTSPVQIRTMRAGPPPHRIIAPGRTYRSDSDQTHTPMFHQVEGLVIDKGIHFGHLKGVLETFAQTFFEVEDAQMRYRPSYFPFTEPSAEVDIRCTRVDGELRFGEGDGWMEILGCGMVHPNVLRACDLDPDEWQGFAFGVGIDRIAGLKYGMPDLRSYFDADIRWLRHYGFSAFDVPSRAGGLSS
ncbi:MAG: phenylalanine--tRNA ligase subunit alpha [Alphaproteobacteria bacterium]